MFRDEMTDFDRLVIDEVKKTGQRDLMKVMTILAKHGYEIVRNKHKRYYYLLRFKYRGKKETNMAYIELLLFYTSEIEHNLSAKVNLDETQDWLNYAEEGIWTSFSDIIDFIDFTVTPKKN